MEKMLAQKLIRFTNCCLIFAICAGTFAANLSLTLLADETVPASQRLQNDQEAVSGRYARFERLLSQMADMLGHEDPERAELLRRAISKGRERAISSELNVIAATLGNGEFGAAQERQNDVTLSLQLLLKLLQSEDRRSSVEKDAERLENILKNVRNTITETKAARSSAKNATAPSNAAPAQQKALDRTKDILSDIEQHDDAKAAENEADSESKNGNGKDGEKSESSENEEETPDGSKPGDTPENPKQGDPKSGETETPDQKPGDPESKPPGDSESTDPSENGKTSKPKSQNGGKPSQSQKPSKSQSGDSSESQGGDPQPQDDEKTPGREELEAAKELMLEALEKLKEQEREEALDNQDEAITQLQKAAKELEEILKQLREEEKEMVLAALEARFQRLLVLQTQIYEATVDLSATPRSEWLNNAISQCRELSQQQADLTRECSQTTGLLREDGTSVSILVAVEDIEADMGNVAARLQATETGKLTQLMETDIIEALNELIKATQKEMEEMKSEERQQQQQKSQSQKKPPLVELMAEIRVLRSLQLRVNRRTTQVNELLQEGETDDVAGLALQLGELAIRQNRLRESAGELAERMEKQ
jgi:hypothetical protein